MQKESKLRRTNHLIRSIGPAPYEKFILGGHMVNALANKVLCLAEHNIHTCWKDQTILFKVADILQLCKYQDDAIHFYKDHKAHCKSWIKGPQNCWYCSIDDMCDICCRTQDGKMWLAKIVNAHVKNVMERFVYSC